jgi:RNA polymerase sigma factor (sigma-70 family)
MNDLKRMDVIGLLGPLRRYARSLAPDETQAEDLVQNTLVSTYGRHGSYRSDSNLQSWLLSILHNTFIDGLRRHMAEGGPAPEQAAVQPSRNGRYLAQGSRTSSNPGRWANLQCLGVLSFS